MKNAKKIARKMLKLSILAFIADILIIGYAFFKHTDSFFTTSPNYQHLSTAAPTLWKMSMGSLISAIASFAVALLIAIICCKLAEKKHR